MPKPRMMFTKSLRLLAQEVCTPDEGDNINVGGDYRDELLLSVWAKIVSTSSGVAKNKSPWDSTEWNPPTPGTITPDAGSAVQGSWQVNNVPVPAALSVYRLYVWGVFDDSASFVPAVGTPLDFAFTAGSGGDLLVVGPCDGGSGSDGKAPSPAITALAPGGARRRAPDAMPRVYKMSVDINSLDLDGFGAGFLAEGLISSANLFLTFDERASTATSPTWSASNLADASGLWTLRVDCNSMSPLATLQFQRIDRRSVTRALLWTAHTWQFYTGNRLHADRSASHAFPDIRVEPA